MRLSKFLIVAFTISITYSLSIPSFGQFVVNDTGDQADANPGDGFCATAGFVCTLRAAIEEANAQLGPNTINFDVSISGQTINLGSAFVLTSGNGDQTTINGDIDGDFIPDITIARTGPGFHNGFTVQGANNNIQYLHIIEFINAPNSAVAFDAASSTGNSIIGCYIGTNATASTASATQGNFRGIGIINGAWGNFVGDGTAGGINVIGNNTFGVYINGSNNNTITGDIIGLDITASIPIANLGTGIETIAAIGTVIGGVNPGEGNIISGNSNEGIMLNNCTNSNVLGNLIGLDGTGGVDLGNGKEGIRLQSGSSLNQIGDGTPSGRNIISGNSQEGIEINSSDGNTIIGNYIGLTSNGIFALGNTNDGILISGTSTNNTIGFAGQGNVISGNGGRGMTITGDANFVYGNFIGIQSGGNGFVGNSNAGIVITGSNNEIGVAVAGFGNVISGGNSYGIGVSSGSGNIIEGNYIGLNAGGTFALPNTNEGIRITGTAISTQIGNGTAAGANFISGNNADGILIRDAGVVGVGIVFNYIGVLPDGVSPLGNNGNGISIDINSSFTAVGNTVIANNLNHGIDVQVGATNNIFTQNSIYNNTNKGINIGSGFPNPPTVDNVSPGGIVTGTSDPVALVEIFIDASDEGESYIATVPADGSGNWSYSADITSDFPAGLFNVTATQLIFGTTSEFSPVPFTIPFLPYEVINTNDTGAGSLRWAIENANATAGTDPITFNIPTSDPNYNFLGNQRWSIFPATDLPAITEAVILDATTQPGAANYRILIDGQGSLVNGFFLNTASAAGTEIYGFFLTSFRGAFDASGVNLFYSSLTPSVVGTAGMGNVIVDCNRGISISNATNVQIQGNIIGTDENDTPGIGNDDGIYISAANSQIIGGSIPGDGNLISGNSISGIFINVGGGHTIEGNIIGADSGETSALANGTGINISNGGGHSILNNIIGGNVGNGITLFLSSLNTIQGNFIGISSDGTFDLPNNVGILFTLGLPANDNIIGGTGVGEPNVIAHNNFQGVLLDNANYINNPIVGNSIFCNGSKGIDLGGLGNNNKSAPAITNVLAGSVSGTGVDGDVIHAYRDNSGCDPIQGEEYLGMTTVVGGVWTVSDASIVATDLINATATDASNNTSEFAVNFREPPVAYNATQVTLTNFVANFSIPAGIDDILIDVAANIGFGTPLIQDLSVGLTGTPTITVGLTPGTDYFFRVRSQVGAGFSAYATSNSFRVAPGNALHFSGDNDYVNAGEFMPQSYTKEAWVRIESGSDRNNFISSDDIMNGHYLYAPVVNSYQLSAGHFNVGALTSIIDVVPLDFDKWYHVAVTYDAGTQDMILYKNGQVVGNQPVLNHSDPTVLLGSHNFLNLLTGNLDEVRIWDDVRTQTEIQNNMYDILVGNEANLVAYYRFDQGIPGGDNTTPPINMLPDRSTNNNNGILNGFTLNGANSNWVNSDAQKPIILDATNITIAGFTANWQPVAGATDILIQVDDNPGFGSPLVDDISVAPGGTAAVIQSLSAGIYYYRFKADIGGTITLYSVSSRFVLPPGNALDFDGMDDVVVIPDAPAIDFGDDDFTIEFWISSTRGGGRILNKHNCGTGNGWVISNSSGNIAFYVNVAQLISTNTVIDGNWHHVAVSFNATTNEQSIYIDGLLDGSQIGFNGNANNAPIGIGAWASAACGGAGGDAAQGKLDEVRFWNVTRNQTEIQNNMYNELIGNEFGLAAYYNFNQGIAEGDNTTPLIDILPDLTSNGNDGTLLTPNFVLNGAASNWVNSNAFTPLDPTGLFTTEVSSTQIDLSWTDNAINETGYTIERSDGNNFSYSVLNTVSTDVTTFSDNTVTAENGYFYRVIANGTSGDSNPSNEKFGSTITPPGNALQFDGVDDYINLGTDAALNPASEITVSAWIYPTAYPFQSTIVDHRIYLSQDSYQFILNTSGQIYFSYWTSSVETIVSGSVIPLNQWSHVAASFDGSFVKLFINGVKDQEQPVSGTIDVFGVNTSIGGGNQGIQNYFEGSIDEVRIWDVARSEVDIQSNVFNTLVGNEANLVAYYRFDQGTAGVINTGITTLPDRSLNQNDGTLTNFDLGVADVLMSNWVNSAAMIPDIGGVIASDYNALVALYNATDGANWIDNTNWLTAAPVGTWFGVVISGNRVTDVDLANNNLVGFLPPDVGDLTTVTGFKVWGNLISGSLPVELGNLSNVSLLWLGTNQFTGSIPNELGNLTNLDDLALDNNQLTGSIPTQMGNLTLLTNLELQDNQLSGSIPIELGLLTNLANLELQRNQLSGTIPIELGNLTSITRLRLNVNQLTGTIPIELSVLNNLATLELNDNLISGSIPIELASLANLFDLELQGNLLTGSIPVELGSLSGLTKLDLGSNQLTGNIPVALGNLTNLTNRLSLGDNLLTGSIPVELGNLTNVILLDLGGNQLTGSVPVEFQNLTGTLTLRLDNNLLDNLPDLSSLSSLNTLEANDNLFHFDDIEPNVVITGITYDPQALIPGPGAMALMQGDPLDVTIAVGGSANQYQWVKDGVDITGQTTDNLMINNVTVADAGTYFLRITSTLVSVLTLQSEDIVVTVDAPEINVYFGSDNSGTAIADGQVAVVNFGTAVTGTDINQIFAIENTGAADLTINSIAVTGSDFSLTGASPTSVAIGATEVFTIRLSGANVGSFNSTLTITNDDFDEGTFDYPIAGIIISPEINVFAGVDNTGTIITDGQATAFDVGAIIIGTDLDQNFAIENTGSGDLTITSITVSGTEFSITGTPPTVVGAGVTEVFTVRLSGATSGIFNDVVIIANNDPDEASFDFPITGVVQDAGIVVFSGIDNTGTMVSNGQGTPVVVGNTLQFSPFEATFAIENPGVVPLNIQSISVDNPVFVVVDVPAQVAPGSFEVFTIQVNADTPGVHAAVVTVVSDLGNYTFPIEANVQDIGESPEINVYNVISPNGDGKHDYLRLQNIEAYPENEVFIYSKIGNLVFRMTGYNNAETSRRFEGEANEGKEGNLPNGTYYYFIDKRKTVGGKSRESGFFLLSR